MRLKRFIFGIVLMLVVFLLGGALLQSGGTAYAQGGNLLRNPGFEEGVYTFDPDNFTWLALYPSQREDCQNNQGVYLPCGTANAPLQWIPWWISQSPTDPPWKNRMPEYKPARPPFMNRIQSGQEAAQYFSFQGTHTAGLLQVVNVAPGSRLRFSIYGQAWSTVDDSEFSNQPTTVNMRIGIDPSGGTNPFSQNIVWSGYQQPYDAYSLFTVEATAQADQVTVFTISSPDEQRKHNDIYWDTASLEVIGAGAAPPPPSNDGGTGTTGTTGTGTGGAAVAVAAVAAASGLPTATPNADGEIYAEVQAGDSFWSIAARHGLTIQEIYELNDANESTVIQTGDLILVGRGDPSAPEEEEVEAAAEGEEALEDEAVESTPTPAPTATATAEPGGAICLKAFDDVNQNGLHDADEGMRAAVAFTISTNEQVVANYVTDGISEPYCIRGLDAGNYRITRSVAENENLTTTGDWSVSVADGSEAIFEFGSFMDEAVAEEVAVADTSRTSGGAADTAEVTEAETADAAAMQDEGPEVGRLLTFAGVIVVVLLLLGLAVLFISSRRSTV